MSFCRLNRLNALMFEEIGFKPSKYNAPNVISNPMPGKLSRERYRISIGYFSMLIVLKLIRKETNMIVKTFNFKCLHFLAIQST